MMLLRSMSGFQRAAGLGLLVGVLGIVLAGTGITIEESFGLDSLFAIRGSMETPPDVVVVGIDQNTAGDLGLDDDVDQWDRSVHARLTDNLTRLGASIIVFDLFFTEDRDEGETGDAALAGAIARSRRVVLLENMVLEPPAIRLVLPIPRFSAGARGLAPFPLPKEPATVRQFWTFRDHAGAVYPTLPVVVVQLQALESFVEFRALLERTEFQQLDALPRDQTGLVRADTLRELMRTLRSGFAGNRRLTGAVLRSLENDDRLNPDQRRLWTTLVKVYSGDEGHYLNFYGGPGTISIVPYQRAVRDEPGLDVAGKVVFVGEVELSRVRQGDVFDTVFRRADGVDLTGVEIAATAVANLLTDRPVVRRLDLHLGALLFFGVLACVLACLLPGLKAVAAVLGLGAAYFGAVLLLFVEQNLWLPVVTPLGFQLPLALLLGLFLQFRGEKRKSDRYRPWVPEKAAGAPIQAGAAFGVVLRTDMEGSTTLSDRLADDAAYASLLTQYLELVRRCAVGLGGRILETRGDDVMCFWESTKEESRLRRNACRAALEIRHALDVFNRQQDESRRIGVRIGLHAGWVHVGQVGPVGEVLNTVSRIERANERLGTKILASEEVVAGLDGLLIRGLGSFGLKGKIRPVRIVEIRGFSEAASEDDRELCQVFGTALNAFEAHHWAEAAGIFEGILSRAAQDGPARFYLDLAREFLGKGAPSEGPSTIRL